MSNKVSKTRKPRPRFGSKGWAIRELGLGKRVRRKGWNKDEYLVVYRSMENSDTYLYIKMEGYKATIYSWSDPRDMGIDDWDYYGNIWT